MQRDSLTIVQGDDRADEVKAWAVPGAPAADATTNYRLLLPEEWYRLAPVFAHYGTTLPSPDHASIAVAERDGEIIGFLTLQPMLHVEPVWIAPERTKDVYLPRMLGVLESLLTPLVPDGQGVNLYVFSDTPESGRMAKAHGFAHSPYHVWSKRIEGGK